MPGKGCAVMEERLRFVARLLKGDAMSDLALEFGISRKTVDAIQMTRNERSA